MRLTIHNVVGTIEVYMDVMRAICGDTAGKSMIDCGCCFAPNTPKLGFAERMYIDIKDRVLDHPEEQQFFKQGDVLHELNMIYRFEKKVFDVAIASDFIEHLTPQGGAILINLMKQVSHKQVIFTPLGEIFPLHNTSEHDPEAHHSVWMPEDFELNGFATMVFPDYHLVWGGGGVFAWRIDGKEMRDDFSRVEKELIKMNGMWNSSYEIS